MPLEVLDEFHDYKLPRCDWSYPKDMWPFGDNVKLKACNLSRSCSYECKYCYARRIAKRFHKREPPLYAAKNAVKKLKNPRVRNKYAVVYASMTDPLNNENFEAYKEIFWETLETGLPLIVLTKGSCRDSIITLPCDGAEGAMLIFGVTITTLNSEALKEIEPNAPIPSQRLKLIEEIKELEDDVFYPIFTWVSCTPWNIYTDPIAIFDAANKAKADWIAYEPLHGGPKELQPSYETYRSGKAAIEHRAKKLNMRVFWKDELADINISDICFLEQWIS